MHIVTVGTSPVLARNLWSRIELKGNRRISHIAHPTYDAASWSLVASARSAVFFREHVPPRMPPPDRELLASLEIAGVPTIHNMILSDRFISKLPYQESLAYATFIAQKLFAFYRSLDPAVAIGGFDGLHGSLGFAVAKSLGIPWFALNFSSLPHGSAALCSDLAPASRTVLDPRREETMRSTADRLLREFEDRKIQAAAYIPPKLLSAAFIFKGIPGQLRTLVQIAGRRRLAGYLRFTDNPSSYSIVELFREAIRLRVNVLRMPNRELLAQPPATHYAFFGMHMQPESSIDVFAHFYSNQAHVIELIARSLPPTHSLLVKLHKSDAPNYSRALLTRIAKIPGVRLVSPYADTFAFIKQAKIIFSIQGTIGLEGALLGKPVIMFGDSPAKVFPNVATIGRDPDLPELVRRQMSAREPSRDAIIDAFASFLTPFYPASRNDWSIRPTDEEIDGYVQLFISLENYLRSRVVVLQGNGNK
jgi:hypothetical protein